MKVASLILALLLFATQALAGSDLKECFAHHNQCVADCFDLKGAGAQASCMTQCAGAEAKCAGEIGLKSSEPFIRKKAEQLENLLKEFFDDILPIPQKEAEEGSQTNT